MTAITRHLLLLSTFIATAASAATHTYSLIEVINTNGEAVPFHVSHLQSNGNIAVKTYNDAQHNGVFITYPNDQSISSSNQVSFTFSYHNKTCDLSFDGAALMPKTPVDSSGKIASFCCPSIKNIELIIVGYKDYPITIPDSVFYDNKDLNDIYGDEVVDNIPLSKTTWTYYTNQCLL